MNMLSAKPFKKISSEAFHDKWMWPLITVSYNKANVSEIDLLLK